MIFYIFKPYQIMNSITKEPKTKLSTETYTMNRSTKYLANLNLSFPHIEAQTSPCLQTTDRDRYDKERVARVGLSQRNFSII